MIRILQNPTRNPSNNVFLILNLLDKLSVEMKMKIERGGKTDKESLKKDTRNNDTKAHNKCIKLDFFWL